MKKALRKDIFREIINNKSRFISLFLIVALGVAFFAGIRATEPSMRITIDKKYDKDEVYDLRILSANGLNKEQVEEIKKQDGVYNVTPSYTQDVLYKSEEEQSVFKFMSITENINKITLTEGRMPENNKECIIDSNLIGQTDWKVGDKITLEAENYGYIFKETEFEVVGVCTSPMYLSFERGSTKLGSGKVEAFVYVNEDAFAMPVYTEVYMQVEGAKKYTSLTDEYDEYIDKTQDKLVEKLPEDYYILDRNTMQTYVEFGQDSVRIGKIGKVFPVIFFLVAALVCLTSMTRMVKEKREQIGVLKALGYSKVAIASKFFSFALSASLLGAVLGGMAGCKIFPFVVIKAYNILYYNTGEIQTPINVYYCVLSGVIAVACIIIATLAACMKETLEVPAVLMRPVAPKAGKRILLERIPFIWNRINFSFKSTFRNLLRYKKRLFMTIIGIGGCTALVLVGFGLYDSIIDIVDIQYGQIKPYDYEIELSDMSVLSTITGNAVPDNMQTTNNKTSEENKITASSTGQTVSENTSLTDSTAVLDKLVSDLDNDNRIKDISFVSMNQVDITANDVQKSGYLVVFDNERAGLDTFINLRKRIGGDKLVLDEETIILTEKASSLLEVEKGDTINIKFSETEQYEVKIGEICENYLNNFIYMSPALYKEVFKKDIECNYIFANIDYDVLYDEKEDMKLVDDLAAEILKNPAVSNVNIQKTLMNKFSDMISSLKYVIIVLIVSAGLLAFVVIYNLNNINISERRKELATLKVLGFYDNEVSMYVFRENIILTVFGIVFGIFLGKILHEFVIITAEIDMIMFGRIIKTQSYIYSIVLTLIFSMLINGYMHFTLKKIDMASSMKSVD